MNEDGVLLAIAAITVGEQAGYKAMIEFMKENPGAVMPSTPFPMCVALLKAGVEFTVDSKAHNSDNQKTARTAKN